MRKIIYTKQTDLKDCGVACLMSLVNYYGGYVSREYLRDLTKTTTEGVSVYSLVAASEKLGFETKALRGSVFKLKNNLPVIAHILIDKKIGHFVVITKVLDDEIRVMDPDGGFKSYSISAWNSITTNVYLLFKPKTEILKQAKEKSFLNLIFPIIPSFKTTILFLIFLSLVYTISNVLISYEFQFFIDLISTNNHETLNFIFAFLLVVALLKEITNLFRNNLINYLNHKLDESFVKEVYNHIIKLPYLYFLNRSKADIIARIKDVYVIRDVISKLLVTIVIDLSMLTIVLFLLSKINMKLTFIVLIITFFYVLIIIIYNNLLREKMNLMKEKEVW